MSRARRVLEDALERENVPEERRGEYLERFAIARLLDDMDELPHGAGEEVEIAEDLEMYRRLYARALAAEVVPDGFPGSVGP